MAWSFPIPTSDEPVPIIRLRRLLSGVCADLVAGLRNGSCPLEIAPAPLLPAERRKSHWHAWPELFIQLAGRNRFITPQGEYATSAGSCLLLPPQLAHSERIDHDAGPSASLVVVARDRHLYYHLAWPHPREPWHLAASCPDSVEDETIRTAAACLDCLVLCREDAEARSGLLHAFCSLVGRILRVAPVLEAGHSDRLRLVRNLVQTRLGSPGLSVTKIAAEVGCHPDHLTRLFRRETGETLVAHIRRQRMERARALLSDPRLHISTVARLVGFTDPSYFSRVWRDHFGSRPTSAER